MVDKKGKSRKIKDSDSRRECTKVYYLQVNGKKEKVCLTTFLNTLDIKEWTVRYWLGDSRCFSNGVIALQDIDNA